MRNHDVILFYAKNRKEFLYEKAYRPHTPKNLLRTDRAPNPKGVRIDDCWVDIGSIQQNTAESNKFPTKKPVALLKRIIQASCPAGGLVLDPFCGCGTTVEAADNLGRHWIGVDISAIAVEYVKKCAEEKMHKTIGRDYTLTECDPETMLEYNCLKPYDKQKFLVEKVGGVVGRRGGGDRGVDGTITIHIGDDAEGKPRWGKMVLSVKTGGQCQPAHLRELLGTMTAQNAQMGGLILDREPSREMVQEAARGKFVYKTGNHKGSHPKLQILTADDILDGPPFFTTPPTLIQKKMERKGRSGIL